MTGSLTAAEAASYHDRGYLFPVPALNSAELDEARANLAATERLLGARLLGIGFCAVSAVLAFRFSLANLDNPSAVLRMPLTVLYLAPAVGFTLMGWRMAERALREKPWAS
jgi:hypothetical protein